MHTAEAHWRGTGGDTYTARQTLSVDAREAMFRRAFATGRETEIEPQSVIEFGAGAGDNLVAIRRILPNAELTGIEINPKAYRRLAQALDRPQDCAALGSITKFDWIGAKHDLSLTRGALIHIPPEELRKAYDALYLTSSRWVLVAEYYNPTPVEIEYRGEMGLLWKRDFAGELLDRFPDLRLVDYGFVYHRDAVAAQDDITWFLLEKGRARANPDLGIR